MIGLYTIKTRTCNNTSSTMNYILFLYIAKARVKDVVSTTCHSLLALIIDIYLYLFATVRHSPTNNLCIAPLIFEHRKFYGNSFNFVNFRFLKKLPTFKIFYLRFQKYAKGYIWSLYVHYVYLLI